MARLSSLTFSLVLLAGCAGTGTPLPPSGLNLETACRVFNIVKRAVAAFPVSGSLTWIIEQYVDPICSVTVLVPKDANTAEWVLHNAAALEEASRQEAH